MAKKVIFDGSQVIVEEKVEVNGLFGKQEYVNRRRMSREEYQKEAKKDMQTQLAGLVGAGIIAGGILLLQKGLEKKGKGDCFFKLPWSK